MNNFHDRLVQYFLKRLRRLQMLDLFEAATAASIFDVLPLDAGTPEAGQRWQASEIGRGIVRQIFDGGIPDVQIVRQDPRFSVLINRLSCAMSSAFAKKALTRKERRYYEQYDYDASANPSGTVALLREVEQHDDAYTATSVLLRALAAMVECPSPSSVALVLLLARAIAGTFADMHDFRIAFSGKPKAVRLHAGIPGFERHFGELLDEGVILPFWAIGVDAGEGSGLTSDRSHRRHGKTRRHVLTLSGSSLDDVLLPKTREKIDRALRSSPAPLFLVDERQQIENSWLAAITDKNLKCGTIDDDLLVDVLVHAMGLKPEDARSALVEVDPYVASAGLDDIAIAFRPGRTPAHMLKALEALAGSRADEAETGVARLKAKSGANGKSGKIVANATVISPEPLASDSTHSHDAGSAFTNGVPTQKQQRGQGPSEPGSASKSATSKPGLSVETLAGFGDAKIWALNLKSDIGLWKSGDLSWSDMSARLLLAGPPGTGKTTFAKALGNSLQLPLVVATVADWLEPGYLGDVLQQMTATFKVAEQHAPAILFIDEIDNIGSRSSAGSPGKHDDYWASLVNRLLTLLDGAVKMEGVIVVAATNRPDKIDPALLRSGRLETQVEIGLPDVPALTQILRHHLGSELASVLNSAPPLASLGGRSRNTRRAAHTENAAHRRDQSTSQGDRP